MPEMDGASATRRQTVPLCAVALATGLLLLVPTEWVLLSAAAVLVFVAFFTLVLGSVAHGRMDWIILAWITFFPLGYYFLSFPPEKPIFTLDRLLILLCIFGIVLIDRVQALPILTDIKTAGWWWLGFLIVALLSIWHLSYREMVGPLHILVEDFGMPVLLGWFVMRYFDVRAQVVWLHACSCVMATYIWAIGFAELVTGRNLLAFTDTTQFVQADDIKVLRIDGPFESGSSYALIGIISFFFILYLRRYLPKRLAAWQATLHWVGVLAALGVGLMPMHRGLVIALIAVCLVDYFSNIHLVSRRSWQVLGLFLLGAVVTAKVLIPSLYSDRVTDTGNIYVRLAQHIQTAQVIADYPLLGVGLNCFGDAVSMNSRYFATFRGFESINFTHNTLLSITAETGFLGLVCYVLAQFYFARAIWRTRKLSPWGWQAFLCIFMVYTIFGLDVTSGYFSDVNLWFMLACGVIAQLQAQSVDEVLRRRPVQIA